MGLKNSLKNDKTVRGKEDSSRQLQQLHIYNLRNPAQEALSTNSRKQLTFDSCDVISGKLVVQAVQPDLSGLGMFGE